MVTRREWLVKQGLAKEGRGRFSQAAKDALVRAEKEGITFSDSDSTPAVKTDSKPKDSAPKKKKDSAKESTDNFSATMNPIWENVRWYVEDDGKKKFISGKEVCRSCGYSLDYQACAEPLFPSINTGEMLRVMR